MTSQGPHREPDARARCGAELEAELARCRRDLEQERALRAEHEAILDSLAASIVVQDRHGIIRYANHAAARSLGASTPADLLGEPMATVFQRFSRIVDDAEEPLSHQQAPAQRALRGEPEPEAIIGYRDLETGAERWSLVRARPIPSLDGEISAVVSFYEDITTQKRAETLVREREQRFRSLIEHSADAIVLLEPDGRIRYASPPAARMLGYSVEEFAAQPQQLSDWMHPDDLGAVTRTLSHLTTTPGTVHQHIRFRLHHADGSWHWMEGTASNLLDDPVVHAIVGNYQDITERVVAEERLRFLAEASNILSSSLDYQTTLQHLATLAVERLADWAAIDLLNEQGAIERLVTAHPDPQRLVLADELLRRYPADPDAPGGLAHVLRSAEPVLVPLVSDEMLAAGARDASHLDLLHAIGFHSFMLVPLLARGRAIGALSLVISTPERRYTEDDLALAEELGRRAGIAIDNARLFAESSAARQRAEALARVAHVFAEESLDLPLLLQSVAQQAVALVGDAALIRLGEGASERLYPVASYHTDPEALQLIQRLVGDSPRPANPEIHQQALESGETVLISEVDPEAFRSILPYIERYGIASMAVAPLRVRGRMLGTIVTWRDGGRSPYRADDLTLLQDLSDRAALAIDNAHLYQQVQQALKHRTEFLSIASHELKTPLTSLKGYIQLLQRTLERSPDDSLRLKRTAASLQTQASRFETLVADLLDASRIQQGRLDLVPEPVDLRPLADEVLQRFAHVQIEEQPRRHRLVLDAPESLVGLWDRVRLDQVLTNLVANAIKYSPDGGEVRVTVGLQGSEAEIVVCDEGVGISAVEQAHLFQPFVRGSAGAHSGGTGLGLYISRTIVEQHGGRIQVESEPGRGSRFVVRLPLATTAG